MKIMRTPIEQGPDAYGLWWYRIYEVTDDITFRIVTDSRGEPNEDPHRIWRGLIYKGEECVLEFQKTLKEKNIISSYVTWKSETGLEFMYFHYSELDSIIELIKKEVTPEKNHQKPK